MTTWHVNVGEVTPKLQRQYGGNRSWEDCRTFGFISAGQHLKYSDQLKKLKVDDTVYAYLNKHGYVGVGRVVTEAQMAKDVQLPDGPLLARDLTGTFLKMHSDDKERCDYAVQVNWTQTFDRKQAIHVAAAPYQIVSKLVDPGRIAFLQQHFGIRLDDNNSSEVVLRGEEADQSESSKVGDYSPEGVDRRCAVERQIRERRGQRPFRDSLRKRYGDRCLITGFEVLAVLEAAHICPYRGENDNHPDNGLLLRSDIHTLFDLDLLGIEPEELRVELHPDVVKEYGRFAGVTLGCASDQRPSHEALRLRYEQFRRLLHRRL